MSRAVLLAGLLVLSACESNDPVADNNAGATLPDVEKQPPDEMTGAGDPEGKAAQPVDGANATAATIPAALRGRWALAPADCEPGRADAKGLMTVLPNELRFYESRARLVKINDSSSDSVGGDFSFTGEGMTWSRYQSLKLQGNALVRTETEPVASYTYARCR